MLALALTPHRQADAMPKRASQLARQNAASARRSPPLPPPPHSRPRADRVPRSPRGAASAPTHPPFQSLQDFYKQQEFKTPDPALAAQRRFSADGSVTGVAFLIAGYPWGDSDISWRFVDEVPITRPKITRTNAKIKTKTAKNMGRTEWA